MRHAPRAVTRVAAVGDLHYTATSRGALRPWLSTIHQKADVLLLCGDLTDCGSRAQAEALAHELSVARVPKLAVLGNHEHAVDDPQTVIEVLQQVGVQVLDGAAVVVGGVGFVGASGFVGGFGAHALRPGGEPALRALLATTQAEARKLETALRSLQTEHRIVMLHYAPIVTTVALEPPETHAFFGSSLLEEPLLRHPVRAVFHGHAHRGPLEGATASGTPVYNVAAPLLRRSFPGRPPYRVLTLP